MTSTDIYCTYVTLYRGNKLPPFYIGSSNLRRIENGYHGSIASTLYKNIFKLELKQNPHLFKTKIISRHNTREEAYIKESKFQKQLNVIRSSFYMNRSIAYNHNWGGQYGPMSQTTKAKISKTTLGMPKSEKHAENISKGKMGNRGRTGMTNSPLTRQRISEGKLGKSQPKHECPHCGLIGGNAMLRWHFDNCKAFKPNDYALVSEQLNNPSDL